ncbi:AraC family transcriptional regulator [Noviherbaspirillum massiliense]|uniref:AraC family transcriptional regulator n=1 Tax=Noviherbaspirillum massiliense TaxID=1465823 RepID=UPI0002FF2167|nr:AraC family transcriptional regulator [Noviherbaspirillum massiliense]
MDKKLENQAKSPGSVEGPPASWDYRRSMAGIRLLTAFGIESGSTLDTLLSGSGVTPDQLDDPHAEVSAHQELCVVANLLRVMGAAQQLGIRVGMRYHPTTFGIWGYALISSATVRDAIATALRFLPLTFAFTRVSLHEEGEFASLVFEEPALAHPVRRFLVERDMAAAAALMREILGQLPLDAVEFRFRTPEGTAAAGSRDDPCAALFGLQPNYESARNALVCAEAYLEQPLPQANPLTVAICEEMCEALLERRRQRSGVAAAVRRCLMVPGTGPNDLESVAARLHMTPRTLRRRLQEEGASYRVLLDEARATLCEELLRMERLTHAEIAERLGFSDVSSFIQAFKRWNGVAPGEYRKYRKRP